MALSAVAPRTTQSSSSSTTMLSRGSRGPQVLALQKALAAAGFNPQGFDGFFGPKTEAALRAFQRARGITVDGKAGAETWRTLRAGSAGMLQEGSRGPEVVRLQKALAAAGFNPQGIDGSFGPKTKAALLAFQRSRGIVVDGRAGPQTWAALARPAPSTTGPTPTPGPAPSGDVSRMIAWAKTMIGTKYAAVNPFRFGEVLWDGKPHRSVNGSGTVWQYPKGTRVFDCSGFVVAAFRQLGVDLAAKGIATSWAVHANTTFLKPLSREQLRPGDLITYQASNGVGHVVIYLGDGKTIESSGSKGVHVGEVNWSRVKSFRRVPLPA